MFISDFDTKRVWPASNWVRPSRVFAVVMLAALSPAGAAYADETCAWGELVPGDSVCGDATCTASAGEVFFRASESGCPDGCNVSHWWVDTLAACDMYDAPAFTWLVLCETSAGCDTPCGVVAPGVDLLSDGKFWFTKPQWDALVDESSYVVVGEIDTNSEDRIDRVIAWVSKRTVACVRLPTLSDWGVLAVALLLLTVGTLVIRWRRPIEA